MCAYHIAFIDDNGIVYTCGYSGNYQLGHGDTTEKTEPAIVEGLKNKKIIDTCGNQYYTLFLTNDGDIYSCGNQSYGGLGFGNAKPTIMKPEKIPDLPKIVKFNCGYYHSVAIDLNGQVWTFGYNEYGQLGYGHNQNNYDKPKQIPFFKDNNIKIVEIVCGLYHNAAISDKGKLYTWGYNSNGECGNGATNYLYTPTINKYFDEKKY